MWTPIAHPFLQVLPICVHGGVWKQQNHYDPVCRHNLIRLRVSLAPRLMHEVQETPCHLSSLRILSIGHLTSQYCLQEVGSHPEPVLVGLTRHFTLRLPLIEPEILSDTVGHRMSQTKKRHKKDHLALDWTTWMVTMVWPSP